MLKFNDYLIWYKTVILSKSNETLNLRSIIRSIISPFDEIKLPENATFTRYFWINDDFFLIQDLPAAIFEEVCGCNSFEFRQKTRPKQEDRLANVVEGRRQDDSRFGTQISDELHRKRLICRAKTINFGWIPSKTINLSVKNNQFRMNSIEND